MDQSETVDLPVEQAFGIIEEFVHARDANIDECTQPLHLKASMGSYFSMDRNNAKKDLIFTLERISDKQSSVRFDLSFTKDNVAAVAMLAIILLINVVAAVIPFAGVIFFLVVTLPTLIYIGWWASGRGKIEREFWDYFNFKINEAQERIQTNRVLNLGSSEAELRSKLEKIKEELILGKITEQEYRKQKRHIEVALADLEDEKKDGDMQSTS